MFNLIAEPSTQKAASAALDSYLEILGDSITNYLPLLMERLLVLLDNAPLPVRSTIVGAIGSAAHAADKDFVPYFEATVARIQPFLQLQAEGEERQLRGIATDTLGTIAEAVGKDLFRPLMQSTLKVAFEALELDDSKLRESSFMYFATIASLFTEEFVPFLPNTMEALVTACERAETEDGEFSSSYYYLSRFEADIWLDLSTFQTSSPPRKPSRRTTTTTSRISRRRKESSNSFSEPTTLPSPSRRR